MTVTVRCASICLAIGVLVTPVTAQDVAAPPLEIPLYAGVAPGSESWNWEERWITGLFGTPVLQNVVRPVLQYYPADKRKAAGTAVIVAPGGSFRVLVMDHEGADIARRLSAEGVAAFVLKYRLLYTPPDAASAPAVRPQAGQSVPQLAAADGQQAMRVLRQRAAEFGVRPDRIGMLGFSAGGGVTLAAVSSALETRPNFAVPVYAPIISAAVPEGAPPLFITVAGDDRVVGYQGAINLYSAWRKANVPVELHIFQVGDHGFLKKGGGADRFMDRVIDWMTLNGWLSK